MGGENGRLELLQIEEEEIAILPPELAEMLEDDMDSEDGDHDVAYFPCSEESLSTCLEVSDDEDDQFGKLQIYALFKDSFRKSRCSKMHASKQQNANPINKHIIEVLNCETNIISNLNPLVI